MSTIKVPRTGRQIDTDLTAILAVLNAASDHEGEVLYIRNGQIDFADGEELFDIIPLTDEG